MLKIIADENIPYIKEACEGLGEVTVMAGRKMTRESIKNADCLLVRSVTKVNEELLDGSSVKFVGTATIGFDHIDREYLAQNNIEFTSAPGSNANSVAQYITSALLSLEENFNLDLQQMTLGIVGVGNVGKLVKEKTESLGLKILLNDPPREKAEGSDGFVNLDYLLENSDIVTTHVPLEKDGDFPTFKMANKSFFEKMKNGSFYINSSRGKVCDEEALKSSLESKKLTTAILDVWYNEPDINIELFKKIHIGTPHIAGYSFDGKVNGTTMIVNRAREFFGIKEMWDASPILPKPEIKSLELDGKDDLKNNLSKAVFTIYDIKNDDKDMRTLVDLPKDEYPKAFDNLRKNYPRRREFFNTTLKIKNCIKPLENALSGLGFKIEKI